MQHYYQQLEKDLDQRKQTALYRSRLTIESVEGTEVVVANNRLLAFNSNDYLGHANHPAVKQAFIDAAQKWGVGSGSAHLVTGHTAAHHALEETLAELTGRQRALLFSSGYMANLALLTSFTSKGDHLYQDRLNHASLIDAGNLSAAKSHRYQHADIDSLQRMINTDAPTGTAIKMIVSDGVFSMDGDIAPLKALATLATDHEALLAVDDAHGIGVMGAHGAGSLQRAGLSAQQVPLLMGTLGKALGTAGAFIAGDEVLIETLIQKARSYIYTTAQPAAVAAATSCSVKLLETESWRREHLVSLIRYFRSGVAQLGLNLMPSETAIQPLLAGSAQQAVAWSEQLRAAGILVSAIRPPTVPKGTARLRITLSASHSIEQVDRLLEALSQLKFESEWGLS